MKITVDLDFEMPIYDTYKGKKLLGYARIVGVGYWNSYNEEWDSDYVDFDIESITINGKDCTPLYHMAKELSDSIADKINEGICDDIQRQVFIDKLSKKHISKFPQSRNNIHEYKQS